MTNDATPEVPPQSSSAPPSIAIAVDPASDIAPYEQVRARIAALIAAGELAPGARLPTVRRLANDLDLAVNTVAKSFRELEQAHLIETRGRRGTFVTSASDIADDTARRAANDFVRLMRDLRIPPDDAVTLVREAFER